MSNPTETTTYSLHYHLIRVLAGRFDVETKGIEYVTKKDHVPTFKELLDFLEELNKDNREISITACFPA